MNVLPYGDAAVLVEPDAADQVLALASACASLDGVREVVPAARTLLLVLSEPAAAAAVTSAVSGLSVAPSAPGQGAGEVVLDVVYDGADLDATASELGFDADGLVRAHTAARYSVAFCGFVPGFAYLSGLPDELHAPRLESPRTRVPSGSVGIAGGFSGVYPRESPGGWRLLGRTDATLWDPRRTPPALLAPGTAVRFRAVR